MRRTSVTLKKIKEMKAGTFKKSEENIFNRTLGPLFSKVICAKKISNSQLVFGLLVNVFVLNIISLK